MNGNLPQNAVWMQRGKCTKRHRAGVKERNERYKKMEANKRTAGLLVAGRGSLAIFIPSAQHGRITGSNN